AAHAALAILTAIDQLNRRLSGEMGIEIAVRIGVHTGNVVVGAMGDAQRQEQLAIGETPNIAARLQSATEPGTIAVSAATHQLIRDEFEWREIDPHRVASVAEHMHAYRLVGARSPRSVSNAQAGEDTPLVGRTAELGELWQRWLACRSGRGQPVVIRGEAGIGKSRLLGAFATRVADTEHLWLDGRCSPFYSSTALRPFSEILAALCRTVNLGDSGDGGGDDSGDGAAAQRKRDRLSALVGNAGLPVADTVPFLGSLLAIPEDILGPGAAALSPQMRKQRTLHSLLDLLLALARTRPVVLVIEDLHWVDQSTLDFLGMLARRSADAAIFALYTARPMFQPAQPLGYELVLRRLPDSEVATIAAAVAGGKPLPGEAIRELAA
ncbi:MAG: AAA family ATPase, partial [Myxococcota bacterium]